MGGGSLLGKISNPSKVLLASLSTFALLAIASSFAFSISSAHADTLANGSASSTADVVLNLTSAISIRTLDSTASSEIESLDLELTPTPSGRFVKDTTIVDVATSNTTGYMLYMASDYTNPHTSTSESPVYTTDMIHSDTNVASNYSIPTIDPTHGGTSAGTTISEAEFSMANSSYKNRWGYSLTEKNVAGTYNAIPAYNSPDTINSTVSTAVEHSYTPVTVGVNVDTNIASGVYTNELEFTAIANALPTLFTLNFNGNTTDTVTDLPNPMTHSTVAAQYTFTIPTIIPTTSQEGYVLKEWNTKADGTGTSYMPGDEFTIVADASLVEPGERTLFAVWIQAEKWQVFLSKGGFDIDAYEDFNEALQAEEVNSTIFENQAAMEYLIGNDDLLTELKQTASYSESSVPNLLASSLYTDPEKYNYGLPFYIFNNGPTNVISSYDSLFGQASGGDKSSVSRSAYYDNSSIYVSYTGTDCSCASVLLWINGPIDTTNYVNTGVYVSQTSGTYGRGISLNTAINYSDTRPSGDLEGGYKSISSSGASRFTIQNPGNNYYPAVNIANCTTCVSRKTTALTITRWWFE